ncbi:MAG: glutamate 5-kinase [Candidatus Omnitrophica bacterium]|nr:glutamate 5-kinase [Candidatus Omnitrophota bacterium]
MLPLNFKRWVIKIGSSLFCFKGVIEDLCQGVASIFKNSQIVLVSSGAIFCGMNTLGIKKRPQELSELQATAAIGQIQLMQLYRNYFNKYNLECGQLLLTWEDFNQRRRYLNARNTILSLLKSKVIPVINENDVVSTEEIKFGDNDRLSSLVANLVDADILVILSDVDGLLDENKQPIKVIEKITPQIQTLCRTTDKQTSVGGMISKIEAAKIAINSGIYCIIANGKRKGILNEIMSSPFTAGTLFLPVRKKPLALKRWIAFGAKPKGKLFVDEGAKQALLNKKSLLSVGIVDVEGEFNKGDIVAVLDKDNQEFCRGKVEVNSEKLRMIKGKRFTREIIHRNNLVIL